MEENLKQEIWEQSKEWINAIGEVVNEMAQKLGVASEHVYAVYTRQMFFEGMVEVVSSLIFIAVWLIMTIFAQKGIGKWLKKDAQDYEEMSKYHDPSGFYFTMCLFWVFFLIVVSIQLDDIRIGSMMMFNPEYYTMKDLLDTVKGMIE